MIKLKKKMERNWSTLSTYTGKTDYDNKEFWKGRIIEAKKVTVDSYLVRIKMVNQVFQHVPVGRHVALRKTEVVATEKETVAYTVVPILGEAMKLTPETWRSSDETLNFFIKRYETGFMSKFTTDPLPTNGSTEIYVSTVRGPFLPSFLENKEEVILFAAGTGITPMLSIIVWMLKYHPETTVKLYHFNKEPNFVIMKDELEDLSSKTPGLRFININIYTSNSWLENNHLVHRLEGRVTRSMVQEALKYKKKEKQFVVICGMAPFTFFVEDVLSVMGYEINKNYFPFRKPRDDIPKTEDEFKHLHPNG